LDDNNPIASSSKVKLDNSPDSFDRLFPKKEDLVEFIDQPTSKNSKILTQ
jgi:hypothetical protein